MIELDPITSATNIIGASSPYYIIAEDSTLSWNAIELRLYVWHGEIDDVNQTTPHILRKGKLMTEDKRVELEISDYLVNRIEPMIDPFSYETVFGASAVFFYYELDYLNIVNGVGTVLRTDPSPLKLATLGWRYSFESNTSNPQQYVNGSIMANGWELSQFSDNNQFYKNKVDYPEYMANYIFSFKKNLPISDSNEAFLVTPFEVSPDKIVCGKGSYGVMFLNKTGVWDTLPFIGKSQENSKTTADTYNRGYRDSFNYQPQYQGSVVEINKEETLTFTLNTGSISQTLSAYYEELLYSPMLMVVDYEKRVSYPVRLVNSNYVRKYKATDKNKINHTFVFEANNNIVKKW